jgi:threonylcarbamoyladenosine tRNA methylthiotransferase MtaB
MEKMLKVALSTIGCKLNQFEMMGMREFFVERGYQIVPFPTPADIYVINTCTVTGKSDYRSRQAIRKAVKANPASFVVVTGCYAQLNPQEISRIKGVDLILGNNEKFFFHRYFTEPKELMSPRIWTSDLSDAPPFATYPIKSFPGYTRAFVKIQDGCDAACSYCAVREARGPNRSEKPRKIISQIEQLVAAGYKEVVLTGIHLGTYGLDLGHDINLAGLLKRLKEVSSLRQIRLSSIEPKEFTPELIHEIADNPKVCHHLHIPLQSGDPEILSWMNRDYDPHYYFTLVHRLKSVMPEIAMGADVIVGFPGEEEHHFRNTYRFIQELPISYLHVFSYSKRKGTLAANLPQQISGEIKRERSLELRRLGKQKNLAFKKDFLEKTIEVLVENTRDKETGYLKGITDNYIKVLIQGADERMNNYYRVKVAAIKSDKVYGVWEQ